jgi:murein tripeptide amidase MpaA
MKISDHFDGGAIEIININANKARLNIRRDSNADFTQWFYFRVYIDSLNACEFELENASKSSYPDGWENYHPVYSYDRKHWHRIPESIYDGKALKFMLEPEQKSFFIAYFAPYTFDQHLDLLGKAQNSDQCELIPVCKTADGRDLDLLKIGTGPRSYWITARQHPGETMAEWFVEGFIEKLICKNDSIAQQLLKDVTFYIVPNMNPDGSARGNLRTNAAGANLNREWLTPSVETSPEVYHILKFMEKIGVDLSLDVHGDEAIPYNFVAGNEGAPNYTSEIAALENLFKKTLLSVSCEFQTKYGYDLIEAGTSDLLKATDMIGNKFKCLALTIEMPFKDNDHFPDKLHGWSPARCKQFAYDVLVTLSKMINTPTDKA